VKARQFWIAGFAILLSVSWGGSSAQQPTAPDNREAKKVFGAIQAPAGQSAQVIGQYDRGCIAGGQRIAATSEAWQAMRLSRNRVWGHPDLIAYIGKLANSAQSLDGLPGILVGDLAQPMGGPLLGGHASHQTGLDADFWYTLMPVSTLSAEERERLAAQNVVDQVTLSINNLWTESQFKLLKRSASFPEVARIFVHPAVKKALCDAAGAEREWLYKIRPWYKHDDHFHVRLNCPAGSPACVAQPALAAEEDGCGKELDDWFKKLREPRKKPPKPPLPPKPMLVSDLPKECQALVATSDPTEKP